MGGGKLPKRGDTYTDKLIHIVVQQKQKNIVKKLYFNLTKK